MRCRVCLERQSQNGSENSIKRDMKNQLRKMDQNAQFRKWINSWVQKGSCSQKDGLSLRSETELCKSCNGFGIWANSVNSHYATLPQSIKVGKPKFLKWCCFNFETVHILLTLGYYH